MTTALPSPLSPPHHRCDVSGEGLPAAMLPYCGRSMLEGQVRDLQAQEYLYWHLTGTQVRGRVRE